MNDEYRLAPNIQQALGVPNPVPVYGGPLDGGEIWARKGVPDPWDGAEMIVTENRPVRSLYVYRNRRWNYVKSWRESEDTP